MCTFRNLASWRGSPTSLLLFNSGPALGAGCVAWRICSHVLPEEISSLARWRSNLVRIRCSHTAAPICFPRTWPRPWSTASSLPATLNRRSPSSPITASELMISSAAKPCCCTPLCALFLHNSTYFWTDDAGARHRLTQAEGGDVGFVRPWPRAGPSGGVPARFLG